MPSKNMMGESFKYVDVKINVTKKILGVLPIEYADINSTKIQVKKINEVIKPVKKNLLVREEKNRINSFRVDLELDFA